MTARRSHASGLPELPNQGTGRIGFAAVYLQDLGMAWLNVRLPSHADLLESLLQIKC